MPFDSIIWDLDDDPNGNVQHCAQHGVTKEEVEEVFQKATDADVSRSSGRPVVFGPNMQNFKAIAAEFVAREAGVQVPDATAFERTVSELLGDPKRRAAIAAAAKQVVQANVGATSRTVELVAQSLAGRW